MVWNHAASPSPAGSPTVMPLLLSSPPGRSPGLRSVPHPSVAGPRQRCIRGFTLVELVIVVAILAILVAIAVPSYQNYVTRSKIRTAQSDLLALSALVENHRQRTLSYPAAAATGTAAVRAAFEGWSPASDERDFNFSYDSDGGYTLSAAGAAGRLTGCTLTLTDDNQRTASGCPAVGDTAW